MMKNLPIGTQVSGEVIKVYEANGPYGLEYFETPSDAWSLANAHRSNVRERWALKIRSKVADEEDEGYILLYEVQVHTPGLSHEDRIRLRQEALDILSTQHKIALGLEIE